MSSPPSSQSLCAPTPVRVKLDPNNVQITTNGRLNIKLNRSNKQYRCPPEMPGTSIDEVYRRYLGCTPANSPQERTKRYLRGVACLRDRLKTSSRYNHTNKGHAHAINLAINHIIQCQPSKPILRPTNQVVNPSKFGPIKHMRMAYVDRKRDTLKTINQHKINNAYYQKLVNHMARYNTWLTKLEKELKKSLQVSQYSNQPAFSPSRPKKKGL